MRLVVFATIGLCLGLSQAQAQEPSPAPPPSEALRDRAAETPTDGRYAPYALPMLRLPPPFPQVLWRLPADAYPQPEATPAATPVVQETPAPTPEPTAEPTPEPTPEPTAEPTPEPTPVATAEPTAEPTPVASPELPELGAPISGILYLRDGKTPAAHRLAVLLNKDTGRIVATTMADGDGLYTFPPQPKASYKIMLGRKIRRPN